MLRHSRSAFISGRSLLLALAVVLAAAPALAQRGVIRGKITDPDGNPIEGVKVSIVLLDGGGRPVTLETNDKGEFIRPGLPVNTYRASFELDGYEPIQAIVPVSSGGQAFVNETMHPLPEGVLSPAQAAVADAHLQKANDAFGDGDFQTAVTEFGAFVELVPNSGPAYFNLAGAQVQMGDVPAAIASYEKAFELGPDMEEAMVFVADLHGKQQQWELAIAAFDKIMEVVESNGRHLFNYGVFALNAERTELGIEFFEKAGQADPPVPQAYFQLGVAKFDDDPEGAAAAIERYLELEPDGAQAATAKELLDSLRQPGQ